MKLKKNAHPRLAAALTLVLTAMPGIAPQARAEYLIGPGFHPRPAVTGEQVETGAGGSYIHPLPAVTLAEAKAIVVSAQRKARAVAAELNDIPKEMWGVLVLLPYADEYRALPAPTKANIEKALDAKEKYWSEVKYAFYYEQRKHEERLRDSLAELAGKGEVDLSDGDIFNTASRWVKKGTNLAELEKVAEAIIRDIRQDRAAMSRLKGDARFIADEEYIRIKRRFFESFSGIQPGGGVKLLSAPPPKESESEECKTRDDHPCELSRCPTALMAW